eukprot:gene39691-10952_t
MLRRSWRLLSAARAAALKQLSRGSGGGGARRAGPCTPYRAPTADRVPAASPVASGGPPHLSVPLPADAEPAAVRKAYLGLCRDRPRLG